MIIHKGGCPSGFKRTRASSVEEDMADLSVDDKDKYPKLYHIRGTSPAECKAISVDALAKNLNTNDALVLFETKMKAVTWLGKGVSDEEAELAKDLASRLGGSGVFICLYSSSFLNIVQGDSTSLRNFIPLLYSNCISKSSQQATTTTLKESEETDEFWELLGGKTEYASDPCLSDPDFAPRLFQVSNATGALRVDEIWDFTQEDLIDEDVMLLDTFSTVYVWIGSLAHREEQKEAPKIAAEYVKTATDGRDMSIVVLKSLRSLSDLLDVVFV